jgi:hypothetical protein
MLLGPCEPEIIRCLGGAGGYVDYVRFHTYMLWEGMEVKEAGVMLVI